MSGDELTRKFDLPENDNPTELLATPPPDGPPASTVDASRPRRRIIVFAVIGALLLAALVVVLVLLLTRNSATSPSASPSTTPSTTPSSSETPASTPSAAPSTSATAEPTVAPPPPPAGAAIESFETSTPTVFCNTAVPSPQYVSFTWSSTNVDSVEFGVVGGGTSTAYFINLPPSGDNSDFPGDNTDFAYGCPQSSITYYLRVVGSDGKEDLEAITVENTGDKG